MSDHDFRSDTPGLSITSRRTNETLRIRVAGDLDACTAADFRDQIAILLADGTELDLAEVGFCDVRGARELLRVYRHARRQGTALSLVAVSRPVQTLMHLLGIDPWTGSPLRGRRPA